MINNYERSAAIGYWRGGASTSEIAAILNCKEYEIRMTINIIKNKKQFYEVGVPRMKEFLDYINSTKNNYLEIQLAFLRAELNSCNLETLLLYENLQKGGSVEEIFDFVSKLEDEDETKETFVEQLLKTYSILELTNLVMLNNILTDDDDGEDEDHISLPTVTLDRYRKALRIKLNVSNKK